MYILELVGYQYSLVNYTEYFSNIQTRRLVIQSSWIQLLKKFRKNWLGFLHVNLHVVCASLVSLFFLKEPVAIILAM